MDRPQTRSLRPARARRVRAGLRRHGLVRRPATIRRLMRARELRFLPGNRVALFDNGRDGLAAMLGEIEQARERIHLETYILRADATGRRFLELLEQKARAGVDVRLIWDAVGCRGLDRQALVPLRQAGAQMVEFNPLGLLGGVAPRRRDHRKILVIDGRVGFTGGLNIGDEYADTQADGQPAWRDAHVRLEGPVVRDLEAVFLESWFRADGPPLAWSDLLGELPAPVGDVVCAVLADGPAYRRRRTRDVLVSALEQVQREALFVSPYFAPGRRLLEALARAGKRGSRVELLLAGRTDHPILRRAARWILPRLLAAGVRVAEFERAMMHGKVAVFDRHWAILGTSNLDRQSFEHSFEVNIILEGGGVPELLARSFAKDFASSPRVDSPALAKRGLWERFLDRLAALALLFV